MDFDAYRKAFFVDPAPQQKYKFTSAVGATLFYEDYEAAIAFYEEVLGPPAYVEGDGTRGWPIGDGWLTLLRGAFGGPRNVELTLELARPDQAEALQAQFISSGGKGQAPSDQLMYRPVRSCPVVDPFGLEIMIVAPLEQDHPAG